MEVSSSGRGGSVVVFGNVGVVISGFKSVVAVVISDEGIVVCVAGSGSVMTMSIGQVGLPPKKVTSARYTHSLLGKRWNRRVSSDRVVLAGIHTLTNDPQDVVNVVDIAITPCYNNN